MEGKRTKANEGGSMLPELVELIAECIEEPHALFRFLRALPSWQRSPLFQALVELAQQHSISSLWPVLYIPERNTAKSMDTYGKAMSRHPLVHIAVDELTVWLDQLVSSCRLRTCVAKSDLEMLPSMVKPLLVQLELELDTTDSIVCLGEFVASLPALKTLRLEFIWTSLHTNPAMEQLYQCTKHLHLDYAGFSFQNGSELPIESAEAIARYIRAQSVAAINLHGIEVNSSSAALLSQAITESNSITSLALTQSRTLVKALITPISASNWRCLEMHQHTSSCRNPPEDLAMQCALNVMEGLSLNDVSWFYIEDVWCRLPSLPYLKELNLWVDQGCLNESEFALFISTLCQLRLERFILHASQLLTNYCGREEVFLANLSQQHHLRELSMHFIMLTNAGIAQLIASMVRLPRLSTLDLRYNNYDDKCLPSLQKLVQNCQFQHIYLNDNLSLQTEESLQDLAAQNLDLVLEFDSKC